jgi:hypothetical protein
MPARLTTASLGTVLCRLTGVLSGRGLERARLARWLLFVTDIGDRVLFVIFSMVDVGCRCDMVCDHDRFSRGGPFHGGPFHGGRRRNDRRLAVSLGRQYPVNGEFRDAVAGARDLKHLGCLGR